MGRRIAAIILIYVVAAVAWFVLGGTLLKRTYDVGPRLKKDVAALWGAPQSQASPELAFCWDEAVEEKETVTDSTGSRVVSHVKTVTRRTPVMLDHSHVSAAFDLDQRRRGLLWYATYGVRFRGEYAYTNTEERDGTLVIRYRFPAANAVYDDFTMRVDGREDTRLAPVAEGGEKFVEQRVALRRGERVPFEVAYATRGLDSWRYSFGPEVSRVKDFRLTMTTDFKEIDFPEGTISPNSRRETPQGHVLEWASSNLISGYDVGLTMPQRLAPGPLAATISFFAPICLGFFFSWLFVITLMRGIDLHPINYLFLAASFFAFHLLFAYSVDHVPLGPAFAACSVVSVGLVVSYLRLVVGLRFAALYAGAAQFVYLVLFSLAHFFEGFTGLMVTIGSILTLFALMQLTGRVRWADVFQRGATAPATAARL